MGQQSGHVGGERMTSSEQQQRPRERNAMRVYCGKEIENTKERHLNIACLSAGSGGGGGVTASCSVGRPFVQARALVLFLVLL